MKLIDDLIAHAKCNNAPVKDVRVGVSWTGVWGKYCGLAKTYGIPVVHGNYTRDMGHLTERTALELAEYSRSWNLIEASIGVAAISSMTKAARSVDINARDLILKKAMDKKVAISGSFPFTPELKKLAREISIFELDQSKLDPVNNIITETAAEHIIPECEVVIITGSTLINKSAERLLELARLARAYTVVLGPSTPMSEVWFDYGVDLVGGVEVLNPQAVLLKLSQSGGMLDTRVCPGEIIFKAIER
ncbi:MAG: DUF364 domain-containing protein [Dehalococcoidales bacterium]|nr:DUF364 domain-containing protein [Dehalococcoidales bacterium]